MADDVPDVVDDDQERPLEQVAGGVVMAVTFAAGFGMLALDVPMWWVAFPVGFAGLMPLAVGIARWYEQDDRSESTATSASASAQDDPRDAEDALEELRRRYARGEMDEAEFERRVERLLETDSVNRAREYAERADADSDAPGEEVDERDVETETE